MQIKPGRLLKILGFGVVVYFIMGMSECGKEFETVVLEPNSKRFYFFISSYRNAGEFGDAAGIANCPIGCFYTMGRSCREDLPGDDSTVVGFSRNYYDGDWPCRCWESTNCVYRGYVGFDLTPINKKGVVSAILKWKETNKKVMAMLLQMQHV